jgi:hypothetical protein
MAICTVTVLWIPILLDTGLINIGSGEVLTILRYTITILHVQYIRIVLTAGLMDHDLTDNIIELTFKVITIWIQKLCVDDFINMLYNIKLIIS